MPRQTGKDAPVGQETETSWDCVLFSHALAPGGSSVERHRAAGYEKFRPNARRRSGSWSDNREECHQRRNRLDRVVASNPGMSGSRDLNMLGDGGEGATRRKVSS